MLQHMLNFADTVSYGYTTTSTSANVPTWFWPVYIGFAIVWYVVLGYFLSRVFKKAGRPSWAAFVPGYNAWLMLEMGGQSGKTIFWNLLPFVGPIIFLVYSIKAYLEIGRRFGKSTVFSVFGLILFQAIGIIILAFDKSVYQDPNNPSYPDSNAGNVGGPSPVVSAPYQAPAMVEPVSAAPVQAAQPYQTTQPLQPSQQFQQPQPIQPAQPVQPTVPTYPPNDQQPPVSPTQPTIQ